MNLNIGDKVYNFIANLDSNKRGLIVTIRDITKTEITVEFKDGSIEKYNIKELKNLKRY